MADGKIINAADRTGILDIEAEMAYAAAQITDFVPVPGENDPKDYGVSETLDEFNNGGPNATNTAQDGLTSIFPQRNSVSMSLATPSPSSSTIFQPVEDRNMKPFMTPELNLEREIGGPKVMSPNGTTIATSGVTSNEASDNVRLYLGYGRESMEIGQGIDFQMTQNFVDPNLIEALEEEKRKREHALLHPEAEHMTNQDWQVAANNPDFTEGGEHLHASRQTHHRMERKPGGGMGSP